VHRVVELFVGHLDMGRCSSGGRKRAHESKPGFGAGSAVLERVFWWKKPCEQPASCQLSLVVRKQEKHDQSKCDSNDGPSAAIQKAWYEPLQQRGRGFGVERVWCGRGARRMPER